jgi:DNA repair protein RAD50
LKAFKLELLEPKYKEIEKRLLDLNVKYHLTKDIATEVNDKHDALEEALMSYHHEKMKEINRTLADFWKITYKGTDIETIMIKTDAEKSQET